jgi:Rieske Fe-S protein
VPVQRSRREVVRDVAAGGLGVAALLAGCGTTAPGPVAPVDPAPAPEPVAAGSSGTVLGDAAAVPVGGGAVFADLEVVVTQPAAGEYRGFSAVCTHTACIVARVADGLIECPCHGSRFRLDGTVAAGPAPRALPDRPVTARDGRLYLS